MLPWQICIWTKTPVRPSLPKKWIFIEVAILNVSFVFMSQRSDKVFSWNCIYKNIFILEWYVKVRNEIRERSHLLRIAESNYKFELISNLQRHLIVPLLTWPAIGFVHKRIPLYSYFELIPFEVKHTNLNEFF